MELDVFYNFFFFFFGFQLVSCAFGIKCVPQLSRYIIWLVLRGYIITNNNNNKRKLRGAQPLGTINIITNASFSMFVCVYRRRITTLTSFQFPVSLVMILSKVFNPYVRTNIHPTVLILHSQYIILLLNILLACDGV